MNNPESLPHHSMDFISTDVKRLPSSSFPLSRTKYRNSGILSKIGQVVYELFQLYR